MQRGVFTSGIRLENIELTRRPRSVRDIEGSEVETITSFASTLKRAEDYSPEPYEYLYKPWSYKNDKEEWIQLLDNSSILI